MTASRYQSSGPSTGRLTLDRAARWPRLIAAPCDGLRSTWCGRWCRAEPERRHVRWLARGLARSRETFDREHERRRDGGVEVDAGVGAVPAGPGTPVEVVDDVVGHVVRQAEGREV